MTTQDPPTRGTAGAGLAVGAASREVSGRAGDPLRGARQSPQNRLWGTSASASPLTPPPPPMPPGKVSVTPNPVPSPRLSALGYILLAASSALLPPASVSPPRAAGDSRQPPGRARGGTRSSLGSDQLPLPRGEGGSPLPRVRGAAHGPAGWFCCPVLALSLPVGECVLSLPVLSCQEIS